MTRARIALLVTMIVIVAAACGGDSGSTTTTTAVPDGDGTTTAAGTETTEVPADTTAASGDPIRVGIISSTSGPLQGYGDQYLSGLEAGLAYATGGTGA
ncbi:MAG: hypothetical protein ACR2JP_05235, partial [Acidimicrobiia bacterium]